MSLLQAILVIFFWVCGSLVVYSYAVYPLVIWILSSGAGAKRKNDANAESRSQLPTVAVLIAAYNEEAFIKQRIENLLALDYPRELCDIVIACDGGSDRTAEIALQFASRGVRVLDYKQRRGKTTVLKTAVATLTSQIIILSDANTFFEPSAARRLVHWFDDPSVGVVCGKLLLTDPVTGRNPDGLYWRYETFIKNCEGKLGALLGSNGAIYAIRRELFPEVPSNTLVDDFVIPLLAKINSNCRIVFDPAAIATEEIAPEIKDEFWRRVRIGAGGYQAIGLLWRLLDPRRGWVALAFFSHKVLRWLCPFLLIGAFLCTLSLLPFRFFQVALAVQLLLFVVAPLLARIRGRGPVLKFIRVAAMFTMMNAALFMGFFRWLRGRSSGVWMRTLRVADGTQSQDDQAASALQNQADPAFRAVPEPVLNSETWPISVSPGGSQESS